MTKLLFMFLIETAMIHMGMDCETVADFTSPSKNEGDTVERMHSQINCFSRLYNGHLEI